MLFLFVIRILLFGTLNFSSGPAMAGDCAPVRLEMPAVANQGKLNLCYAHSATQLLEFQTHVKISALEAALGTKAQKAEPELPDWGHACEVVEYLDAAGGCAPSHISAKFSDPATSRQAIDYLASYHAMYHRIGTNALGRQVVAQSALYYLEHELKIARSRLPSENEMQKLLSTSSVSKFLHSVIARDCSSQARAKIAATDLRCTLTEPNEQFLNQQLSETRQPIGINYCQQILFQGSSFSGVLDSKPQSHCHRHSSLIIAQRQVAGGSGCQVLVRNSWGRSCSGYSREWGCDNGDLWIDRAALLRNSYQFFSLQTAGVI